MEGVLLSVEIKHRLNTIKKLKLVNSHQKRIKLVISHQLRKSYHEIYQYHRSDQEDMLKHHQEAFEKHEKMVRSHENSIMQMISGNKTQTNKRLHNLSKNNTKLIHLLTQAITLIYKIGVRVMKQGYKDKDTFFLHVFSHWVRKWHP